MRLTSERMERLTSEVTIAVLFGRPDGLRVLASCGTRRLDRSRRKHTLT